MNDTLNTRDILFIYSDIFLNKRLNSSNNDYYHGTCGVGLFKTVIIVLLTKSY